MDCVRLFVGMKLVNWQCVNKALFSRAGGGGGGGGI